MTKYFALCLFSNFIFWTTFNPKTGLNNIRPLSHYLPIVDSYAKDGRYLMGAD